MAQIAKIHAEICAALLNNGKTIGAKIAATALMHNYSVLTYNHSGFSRVPGLLLINIQL